MIEDNITIRRMNVADIEAIEVIENLCFSLPWSYESFYNEIQSNRLAHYFIILFNDKIVGYIGLWQVLDESHITNIAIHPDFRRLGLASELIGYTLNFCREAGILSVTLEVRESNIPAQNLYKNFGFCTNGFRKQYYSDNHEDAIIMWKHDI